MNKEITDMTNEEMLTAIIEHMDSMEYGLNGRMDDLKVELNGRMDNLETRIDELEANMDMEFQAVRMEMSVVNNSLKKDNSILHDKIDRLMFIKDVDGYEKMKAQVEVLSQGYQELSEKIS